MIADLTDILLFCFGHGCACAFQSAFVPLFDFKKDKAASIPANDIYFSGPDPVVPFTDINAVFLQKAYCPVFSNISVFSCIDYPSSALFDLKASLCRSGIFPFSENSHNSLSAHQVIVILYLIRIPVYQCLLEQHFGFSGDQLFAAET